MKKYPDIAADDKSPAHRVLMTVAGYPVLGGISAEYVRDFLRSGNKREQLRDAMRALGTEHYETTMSNHIDDAICGGSIAVALVSPVGYVWRGTHQELIQARMKQLENLEHVLDMPSSLEDARDCLCSALLADVFSDPSAAPSTRYRQIFEHGSVLLVGLVASCNRNDVITALQTADDTVAFIKDVMYRRANNWLTSGWSGLLYLQHVQSECPSNASEIREELINYRRDQLTMALNNTGITSNAAVVVVERETTSVESRNAAFNKILDLCRHDVSSRVDHELGVLEEMLVWCQANESTFSSLMSASTKYKVTALPPMRHELLYHTLCEKDRMNVCKSATMILGPRWVCRLAFSRLVVESAAVAYLRQRLDSWSGDKDFRHDIDMSAINVNTHWLLGKESRMVVNWLSMLFPDIFNETFSLRTEHIVKSRSCTSSNMVSRILRNRSIDPDSIWPHQCHPVYTSINPDIDWNRFEGSTIDGGVQVGI